jgi:hypothetical protein
MCSNNVVLSCEQWVSMCSSNVELKLINSVPLGVAAMGAVCECVWQQWEGCVNVCGSSVSSV